MSSDTVNFLLDANVLIEAHRRYYSFDICPGFRDCLLHHQTHSRVLSVDKIKDELMTKDSLHNWIKENQLIKMFKSTNNVEVAVRFSSIMRHIQNSNQYTSEAKAEFAQVADGWLIAYALEYGCTVVTHEVENLGIKRKVPIPNVCNFFKVKYVDTFSMLRSFNTEFNWKQP